MQTKSIVQEAADQVVKKAKAGTSYPIAIQEACSRGIDRARLMAELSRRREASRQAKQAKLKAGAR